MFKSESLHWLGAFKCLNQKSEMIKSCDSLTLTHLQTDTAGVRDIIIITLATMLHLSQILDSCWKYCTGLKHKWISYFKFYIFWEMKERMNYCVNLPSMAQIPQAPSGGVLGCVGETRKPVLSSLWSMASWSSSQNGKPASRASVTFRTGAGTLRTGAETFRTGEGGARNEIF